MSLLLDQPFLVAPFVAYVIAQVGKFGLRDFHGERDFPYLYRSGGMPSAHTAVVGALATTVWAVEGFYSPVFALAAWLAAIVTYDALGVRRTTGEQTAAIKQLQAHVKMSSKERTHHMHDAKGHTPRQVFVGGVLGVLTGLCFTPNFWGMRVSWLTESLTPIELRVMSVLYIALLIGSLLFYLALVRSENVTSKTRKAVGYGLIIPIVSGLVLSYIGITSTLDSIMLFYALLPLLAASFLTFFAASHITIERTRAKATKSS